MLFQFEILIIRSYQGMCNGVKLRRADKLTNAMRGDNANCAALTHIVVRILFHVVLEHLRPSTSRSSMGREFMCQQ
jgi:hypothetical protein